MNPGQTNGPDLVINQNKTARSAKKVREETTGICIVRKSSPW
jgi:hypothetical protein